ncbi:MAG: quinone-dependent dihydroorotate dehydrogenase [Bdellovibrionales bacterium]|nr:quinone-dependent dihydroorotate dehydrogenase [Bdellovibrionales bacterium]
MKPWLWLSPEMAYQLAPHALRLYTHISKPKQLTWKPLTWRGLTFQNPLGTSGGVDKNAEHIQDWWRWGVGFQELGTITPQPQTPNPGKIINRSAAKKLVWNKMGFPNEGMAQFLKNISQTPRPYLTPLLINIGKNRWTPNEKAHEDYIFGLKALYSTADIFVINISSPNTAGLRDLLKPENLKNFLEPIVSTNLELAGANKAKPLLLKLSPDQSIEELESTLNTSLQLGIDGWILTNTTNQLGHQYHMPTEGGISGAPLADISRNLLQSAVEILGNRKKDHLLISSGGILTPNDVFERLELGADLVQVYAALIFEGPQFFSSVAKSAIRRYS